MIRLENSLEKNYFSLWEDVGVLEGELKKKGLMNGKGAVTLEWVLQHKFVSYVGA